MQETEDLVTFTGKILKGKLHFFVHCHLNVSKGSKYTSVPLTNVYHFQLAERCSYKEVL